MPRLPKMIPCPFCGSTNPKRDSWGEGFHHSVSRYVGQIECRSCGGMMRAEFFPSPGTTAREGHAEVRKIVTDAWNRRAEGGAE